MAVLQFKRKTRDEILAIQGFTPAAGEPIFETDTKKLKIGDGVTEYVNLPYIGNGGEVSGTNFYTVDELPEDLSIYSDGDVIVVVTTDVNGTEFRTAYYVAIEGAEKVLKAMDGNYSVENVYFTDDITLAGNYTQVGNITKTQTGTATLEVAGKNVKEAFMSIFTKRLQPTKTESSAKYSTAPDTTDKYEEIGTSVNASVTYALGVNAGSYTYGPATGATAVEAPQGTTDAGKTYKTMYKHMVNGVNSDYVTDNNQSGTITYSFVLDTADVSAYAISSAKVYISEGAVAKDNLGSDSNPVVKTTAGWKDAGTKTLKYKPYIPAYYGFKYVGQTIVPADVTDAQIRAFGSSVTKADAYKKTKPTSFTATDSWMQFFIALPAAWGYTGTVKAKDSNNLDLTIAKVASNVELTFGTDKVQGYDVYCIDNASAYDTKSITLQW